MLSIISQTLETSMLHAEYLGYGMICDGSAKTILENPFPLLSCHISGIYNGFNMSNFKIHRCFQASSTMPFTASNSIETTFTWRQRRFGVDEGDE